MRRCLIVLVAFAMLGACSSSDTAVRKPTTTTGGSGATTTVAVTTTTTPPSNGATILLATHDRSLVAYSPVAPYRARTVIAARARDAKGDDITGQLCRDPRNGRRVVVGFRNGHPGWQALQLSGSDVDNVNAKREGRFAAPDTNSLGASLPIACAFLGDGRIITTQVSAAKPTAATGRLVLWFGSLALGHAPPVPCIVDQRLASPGGIFVSGSRVLVSAAGGRAAAPPGVYEYDAGTFPSSAAACALRTTGGQALAPGIVPTQFIAASDGNHLTTPNAVAFSPTAGLLVASSVSGVIDVFDPATGALRRTVLRPTRSQTIGNRPFATGTPYAIAVGPDGVVYIADSGLVIGDNGIVAGIRSASVRRLVVRGAGASQPVVIAAGLTDVEGVAVWVSPDA